MISFKLGRKVPARTDLHAVPVCADRLDERPDNVDADLLEAQGFKGDVGQVLVVGGAEHLTALVGMGQSSEVDVAVVRRAGAALARAAKRRAKIAVALLDALPDAVSREDAAQALAEGIALGAYTFDPHKSDPKPNEVSTVTVVGTGGQKVTAALERGAAIAAAVHLARDLVNEPGGSLTPTVLAKRAESVAKEKGLKVQVMDKAAIKKAKMGGLLGVNRGSTQQPRFVEISYVPEGKPAARLAFVGKGITFDSGGLDIKTAAGMATMKMDMGGAAAVIGAMSALPAVAPKVAVTAYVPMTDNMLGGDATRPGDVLRIRNGKTVEVLNTDAEGRLILADALSLASERKPDAMVDLATLTGACVVALGQKVAGLMSNDDGFRSQVESAAETAGERLWPLPLPEDYRKQLDSTVADMKNIGTPQGGALTAGLFLKEFVGEGIPWAHIDIAGAAWTDAEDDPLTVKGGTGFGVRLLVELARSFTPAVEPAAG